MRIKDGEVSEAILEDSLRHHLKGRAPEALTVRVARPIDKDETHVMLILNVYGNHRISGLTASRMNKFQFVNYAANGIKGSLLGMASELEKAAQQLREAAS